MLRIALLAAALVFGSSLPAAAEYPERPLTIIVGYPAGGMVDIVARPMAESMKRKFPKGVAVLNRPGGGGSVGTAEAIQSKPDGYTVVLAPNSTLVIHPQLNELPYRTPDDFESILNTISFYTLLAVKADAPWKTVQEFVAAARANPGKLRVGSPGEGTISHLTLERWNLAGNFKTTHVPFSGWGESSPALLGGHIDGVMAQPGEVKPLVDAKKIRVLAVASPRRNPSFPDAPTSKEVGFGEPTGTWFAFVAAKGTPAPVLKYIHDAAKAAMEEPAFVSLMKSRGVDVDYRPGDKVRQDLWKEHREYTEVLKRLGMLKKL
jgi:tripartite-type tricarboxylate transporter receptor subunit TctC